MTAEPGETPPPSATARRKPKVAGAIESGIVAPTQRIAEKLMPDRLSPDRLIHETPVLDQLTGQLDRTRRLLAGDAEEAAEAALARFSDTEGIGAHIAIELAAMDPLAAPDRFPEAHRIALRALEVLDREGSRDPHVPNLGPFSVVVAYVVETVAQYIVKSYAQDVANALKRLYTRREAQCPPDLPERRILARARMEMDRVAPGYGGGGLGGPLLIVGAGVPLLASLAQSLGAINLSNRYLQIGGVAVLFGLFVVLSWVLLRGAAVAHRRSRLIMGEPLAALWATIGHAGDPPEDDSVLFATIAIIITATVWFLLPAAAALFFVLR